MALVHPETAKLGPDEQKKGNYFFTPFEVLAYQRGEELSAADLAIVQGWYAAQGTEMAAAEPKPALTGETNVCWACIEKDDRYEHTCKPETVRPTVASAAFAAPYGGEKPPAKMLRKKVAPPVFNDPLNSLRQIADLAVSSLPENDAYALLVKLAARFDFEIE